MTINRIGLWFVAALLAATLLLRCGEPCPLVTIDEIKECQP